MAKAVKGQVSRADSTVQEEDRQHSDTPLCSPLRQKVTLFHARIQSIMCLGAQSKHTSLRTVSPRPEKHKGSVIYHTVDIIEW